MRVRSPHVLPGSSFGKVTRQVWQVLGTTLRSYVPPRANPNHFQAILQSLSEAQPSGETSLAQNLTELARRIKRRGLLVLLSDCFDDLDALRQALHFLRARGHEIILLHHDGARGTLV
jgi:uncharacterized protein (DUF58 family)